MCSPQLIWESVSRRGAWLRLRPADMQRFMLCPEICLRGVALFRSRVGHIGGRRQHGLRIAIDQQLPDQRLSLAVVTLTQANMANRARFVDQELRWPGRVVRAIVKFCGWLGPLVEGTEGSSESSVRLVSSRERGRAPW